MAQQRPHRPQLTVLPTLVHETLYVGIDVGKFKHIAGFVSATLLAQHQRFEACPVLAFDQSRAGFRAFVDRIRAFVPLEHAYVVLEHTGHYHKALAQYLLELDIAVYVIHVQKRPPGMLKSDKRDALGLANQLYNQLEKGMQLADKCQVVRRLLPPTSAAAHLKGLTRHRYELSGECARRKTKLTAICDELFPEFTEVFRDPNAPMALAYREHYPTPHALATASFDALARIRTRNRPSNVQLVQLQELASQSIGTHDVDRQRSLVLEQDQLIRELRLMQAHIQQLDSEISTIMAHCREGQIVTSIPGIGTIQAATILSAIGNILNFDSAAALKSYCGWAPTIVQSGISMGQARLTPRGTRTMKQMMFLVVAHAIQLDCEWATLYARLVPRKCVYDERTRMYKGKLTVMGRIAGQMLEMIYALLKQDAERVSATPPGMSPPDPIVYNRAIHHAHRTGHYQPIKPRRHPATILQLPPRAG